jgi:hypothetical protein
VALSQTIDSHSLLKFGFKNQKSFEIQEIVR